MKIRKPNKRDFYGGLLAIGMLCFLLLLHSVLYNPADLIKRQIAHRGYTVDELVVERVSFWKGLYKANISVVDDDGRSIEYWQIATLPGTQTVSYAKPYYEPEAE